MNLLLVTSSLFGAASQSRQIAAEFVSAWQGSHPGTTVAERDVNATAIPHLSQDTLAALGTPADKRTPAQQDAVALADALIAEVEAADVIVLAAPMYNFSIPSTLKAWIDHIARAGRTFRYAASGPEGLLKNKKVFIVTGRGGLYSGESPARVLDFQEPYLRGVLGFLGLTDVTFIHVEGLALSPEAADKARDRARQAIGAIVQPLAA
jgi:FMN-dependent NADH-azoreductase